ncbi:hypothetical protein GFL15_25145 [Rhizobium leguminosarum bv. viciae]|nr:hypothetical protein [Rhizobium leguminosarum bv. viciae]
MSRKTVQRFCASDMRKNIDLKREERISKIATRFRPRKPNLNAQDQETQSLLCGSGVRSLRRHPFL